MAKQQLVRLLLGAAVVLALASLCIYAEICWRTGELNIGGMAVSLFISIAATAAFRRSGAPVL